MTGRSWAGTGGQARPPPALKRLHSHFGGLAAFVLLSRGPGQHSWPSLGLRQRQGGSAWAGAPRGNPGSWAVPLACGGPRTGHWEALSEVWPYARAQMRGWGPAGTPGAPLFAHSQTPSPGQPLPCGQRARGHRPLWSSSGPTHPFGPRHQHTEEILEEAEAASLWATLGTGRCPDAPGGAPYNVCKLPGLMGPGLCPQRGGPVALCCLWGDTGQSRTWPLGGQLPGPGRHLPTLTWGRPRPLRQESTANTVHEAKSTLGKPCSRFTGRRRRPQGPQFSSRRDIHS